MRVASNSVAADFVVDFDPKDNFFTVKKLDASKLGGMVVVGDVARKDKNFTFTPKRNMTFDMHELMGISDVMSKLSTELK